jgi:DNA-binding MarR family transcriptional regulator
VSVDLGPLRGFVGYQLRRAQLTVFGRFSAALQGLDLTPGQFAVLIVVDRNPGLTQSATGAALGLQRTNFTPLLHELEARKLVARVASSIDRRAKALALTDAGHRLLTRALTLHERLDADIVERLGQSGRKTLLRLLQTLTAEDPQ